MMQEGWYQRFWTLRSEPEKEQDDSKLFDNV